MTDDRRLFNRVFALHLANAHGTETEMVARVLRMLAEAKPCLVVCGGGISAGRIIGFLGNRNIAVRSPSALHSRVLLVMVEELVERAEEIQHFFAQHAGGPAILWDSSAVAVLAARAFDAPPTAPPGVCLVCGKTGGWHAEGCRGAR